MSKRVLSVILVEDDINECNIYKEIVKEREDIDLVLEITWIWTLK